MGPLWNSIASGRPRWTPRHNLLVAVSLLALCALLPLAQLTLTTAECKQGDARTSPQCRQDVPLDRTNGGPIDYVGLVAVPSCVTRRSIQLLNELQQPRDIYVIVPQLPACQQHLEAAAGNVRCIDEGSVIPGVDKAAVASMLSARHPHLDTDAFEMGRSPAGWYLQQLLKLGALQGLPQLSEYYVIWDFDMLPVRPVPLLYGPPGWAGDLSKYSVLRAVVNIGGARAEGYAEAYRRLFDAELEYARDGTSFVTHWIVVHKPLMREFLGALSHGQGEWAWVERILDSVPDAHLHQGFSEYASYVSWVRQHHPARQHVLRRKTWRRQPLGSALGVWQGAASHPRGLCCPTGGQHALQRLAGLEFYGLELGHHAFCKFHERDVNGTYGLP